MKPEAAVEVDAPPVVVPVVVPKMPLVPELKSKAANTTLVKKGPLKAVEPVPNMVKKSLSSDLLLKVRSHKFGNLISYKNVGLCQE